MRFSEKGVAEMSYESIEDLPKILRDTMPREALEIYLESYK